MLIYEPKGKAREYSPLAFNIFTGCDHGCTYCYVPSCTYRPDANTVPMLRKNVVHLLENELKHGTPTPQVLLSFLCDPYARHDVESAITRQCLEVLCKYECRVAILSKGGTRAMRDVDVLKRFKKTHIKFGTTLTFFEDSLRKQYEPNASSTSDRLAALESMHDAGIKTFASIEPVINPVESLRVIAASLPFVDQYKIGKLNHNKEIESKIDWPKFLSDSLSLVREYGKEVYVKEDLRIAAPNVVLSKNETDMNFLSL